VTEDEQQFLAQAFPHDEREELWLADQEELAQQFAYAEVELPALLSHHEKLAMLSTFYAACAADGEVHPDELRVLKHACATLGLEDRDVESKLQQLWQSP